MSSKLVLDILNHATTELKLPSNVIVSVKRLSSVENGELIVARLHPRDIDDPPPRRSKPVIVANMDDAAARRGDWAGIVGKARVRLQALAREAWPKPYHLAFRPGRRRYPLRTRCAV